MELCGGPTKTTTQNGIGDGAKRGRDEEDEGVREEATPGARKRRRLRGKKGGAVPFVVEPAAIDEAVKSVVITKLRNVQQGELELVAELISDFASEVDFGKVLARWVAAGVIGSERVLTTVYPNCCVKLNLSKSPSFGDAQMMELVAALELGALANLETLDISGTLVSDAGLSKFFDLLGGCLGPSERRSELAPLKDLKKVDVVGTSVGDTSMLALERAARMADGLRNLLGMGWGCSDLSPAGLETLLRIFDAGGLPELKGLGLGGLPIDDAWMEKFANIVLTKSTLRKLLFLNCMVSGVSDAGLAALMAALNAGALPKLALFPLTGLSLSKETMEAMKHILISRERDRPSSGRELFLQRLTNPISSLAV